MFKTGKCCYILKYMEVEILCLGMVLHFGTVETECKKVKLMLNIRISLISSVVAELYISCSMQWKKQPPSFFASIVRFLELMSCVLGLSILLFFSP